MAMSSSWQFVLHQDAFDFVDSLGARGFDGKPLAVANGGDQATERPSPYSIKDLPGFRIVYWLDVWVREVCVVRIDRHKG